MEETFNSEYYSTAAQVIPVFFLAAVASRLLAHDEEDPDPRRSLYVLSVVLAVIVGEAQALTALQSQEEPSRLEDGLIVIAIVLPMILFGYELGTGPVRALAAASPSWLRWLGRVAAILGPIALTVMVFVEPDALGPALAFVILMLVVAPGFVGIVRDFRTIRRTQRPSDERDD